MNSFLHAVVFVGALFPALALAADPQPEDPLPNNLQRDVTGIQESIDSLTPSIDSLAGQVDSISGQSDSLEQHGVKMTETDKEITLEISSDVLFDFDKWNIRPDAEAALSEVAAIVAEHKNSQITVVGHTDAKGTDEYNDALSQKRAASVRNWLIGPGGLRGSRFIVSGAGERMPVAPNTKPDGADDPEGRQKNRRVELKIRK